MKKLLIPIVLLLVMTGCSGNIKGESNDFSREFFMGWSYSS